MTDTPTKGQADGIAAYVAELCDMCGAAVVCDWILEYSDYKRKEWEHEQVRKVRAVRRLAWVPDSHAFVPRPEVVMDNAAQEENRQAGAGIV